MLRTIMVGLTVLCALGTQVAAADPRKGTHACVVEDAYVFGIKTGQAGQWNGAPTTFVLHVSDCSKVKSGEFALSAAADCDSYARHGLVIRTSLEGFEDDWRPAVGTIKFPDQTTIDVPAEFESRLSSPPIWSPARLRLSKNLNFEFVRLDLASNEDSTPMLGLFTLSGKCSPF